MSDGRIVWIWVLGLGKRTLTDNIRVLHLLLFHHCLARLHVVDEGYPNSFIII